MDINLKTAIYAGSFDPFTFGHQEIVERALEIFDQVIILVAKSSSKKNILTTEERIICLKRIFAKNKKIKIDSWQGLIVDYAQKNKIKHLIRGLRPSGDFDSEFQMASMNRDLNRNIDIVFLMAGPKYYFVSSSLVKEVFNYGGDISKYVHDDFIKVMTQKIKKEVIC